MPAVISAARAGWRRFWRQYTRMRTAIMFLIGVVLIVLVGSFVPQQDTSAQAKVDEFLASHGHLNQLATHLGLPLTEVFVSPLFFVLLGSLYIALAACVLRRGRALVVRTLHRHPRTPQYWGEWGSWLFHSSFFLLLIAAVWGKATGFQGIVTVTEGRTVTEAPASFDTLQHGYLFDGNHAGYQVRLNHFGATYDSHGAPSDFVSNVTVLDHGREVQTKDVRVNDYLGYQGVDFYQQDYGWAPHVVVRNPTGATVFDGYVQCFGNDKRVQACVVKVPDFGFVAADGSAEQLGAQLAIFPDAHTQPRVNADGSIDPGATQYTPGGQEARNPVLETKVYLGNLGLDSGPPQDVNALDTRHMYQATATVLPVAMGVTLPLGLTRQDGSAYLGRDGRPALFSITFQDLRQYSLFMVKRDTGVGWVYTSFALLMAGLLVKLYLRPLLERRRRRQRGPVAVLAVRGAVPVGVPDDHEERIPVGSGSG